MISEETKPLLPLRDIVIFPSIIAPLFVGRKKSIKALEEDNDYLLAGDVFTKDQLEGYMELKWEEIHNYEHTPHPVEFMMYYSC